MIARFSGGRSRLAMEMQAPQPIAAPVGYCIISVYESDQTVVERRLQPCDATPASDREVLQVSESTRSLRHRRLAEMLEKEPFLTDEDIAGHFHVSVQTVRLDRMKLGIPELRERMRSVARLHYEHLRSLRPDEVFGDILELDVGCSGTSVWRAQKEHVISRTQVVRGHFLFAQANSLAVAVIDAKQALTARATVRFMKPVRCGAALTARARVLGERHGYSLVDVVICAGADDVFAGRFLLQSTSAPVDGGAAIEDCD